MKHFLLALGLAAALCSQASAGYETVHAPNGLLPENTICVEPWTPNSIYPPCQRVAQAQPSDRVVVTNQPGGIGVVPPAAIIDSGSIAGQVFTWAITVFGGVIATVLTGLIVKLMRKAGIEVSQAASDRLDQILLNGMHAGAAQLTPALVGKGTIEVKNATLAAAVRYVQAHGADTLKTLGVDPNDPKTIEALRARAERLIADPNIATPKALDAPAATG